MNVSMEEKKLEAICRMKKLHIWSQAIKEFEKHCLVLVTEPPIGAVYELEPELRTEVKKFEEEHNALVYIVVRAFTTFGKMDSMLFVSDYVEDWELEDHELDEWIAMTYTINWDYPDCSEMGSIAIRPTPAGGLERVF